MVLSRAGGANTNETSAFPMCLGASGSQSPFSWISTKIIVPGCFLGDCAKKDMGINDFHTFLARTLHFTVFSVWGPEKAWADTHSHCLCRVFAGAPGSVGNAKL